MFHELRLLAEEQRANVEGAVVEFVEYAGATKVIGESTPPIGRC